VTEEKIAKQERSISANTRADVVTLAELTSYWNNQGYYIRSISQLISWSLDLLKDVLEQNKFIEPSFDFVSARTFLRERGLNQQSHEIRERKKIAAATRFEMVRKEGLDPRSVDPKSFAMLHNKHSVQDSPENDIDGDAYQRARLEKQKEMHELYKKERDAKLQVYKDKGFISESKIEDVEERDQELNNKLSGMTLEEMLKSKE
jgi:hypothetical protein